MAQFTLTITNCGISDAALHVKDTDQVRWCSADREYRITGLGNALSGASGQVTVPAGGCTQYYTVDGRPNQYAYNIGPNCPPEGAPEIIIDDTDGGEKPPMGAPNVIIDNV
jgi:hypothetical protein